MNIGVNFFGPKFKLYEDFDGTLERLRACGITSAEICVAFSGHAEPPAELKLHIPEEVLRAMKGGIWDLDTAAERLAAVRAHGLRVISCHVMAGTISTPDHLSALLPTLLEFGAANRISHYVVSLMKTLEPIKAFAPTLNCMAEELAEAGITLCYHNHDMEHLEQDGTTALDYLMEHCPALKLELDVGWAKFAGVSPVALMETYRDRVALLHFKDIRPDASPATRDTCFTAVGEGSIPLREILAVAPLCALPEDGLIIDQDDSPTDILADLATGVRNIRNAVM
ncbi:MAG: sugar phosphate isomerase/epimerase [Oscillospiraceae bacterium]|nr:sugar phosphate isomerase/epimerase [Oscillospiraceae bacterium]